MANLFGNLFGGNEGDRDENHRQAHRDAQRIYNAHREQLAQSLSEGRLIIPTPPDFRQQRAETEQALNEAMAQVSQALSAPAQRRRELEGRQVSAREVLERQRGLHHNLDQVLRSQLTTRQLGLHEAYLEYNGHGVGPNRFTRWLDIRESEDELQEFLVKCVKYGEAMQKSTRMSVEGLES